MSNLLDTQLPASPYAPEEWGPLSNPPAHPRLGLCEHCGKHVDERDARGRVRAAHYWCDNVYDPSDYE
jgi:hypothetical protein